jgi:hypothetical protein
MIHMEFSVEMPMTFSNAKVYIQANRADKHCGQFKCAMIGRSETGRIFPAFGATSNDRMSTRLKL